MPDHVHSLVWFPEPGQLAFFMKQWKRRSSRSVRKPVLPSFETYGSLMRDDDPFRQRKYYAFHISSRDKLGEKLNDMRLNPVRAGLVERAVDWRWSSARYYEDGHTVDVPITWVD
jgi:putative transposase